MERLPHLYAAINQQLLSCNSTRVAFGIADGLPHLIALSNGGGIQAVPASFNETRLINGCKIKAGWYLGAMMSSTDGVSLRSTRISSKFTKALPDADMSRALTSSRRP